MKVAADAVAFTFVVVATNKLLLAVDSVIALPLALPAVGCVAFAEGETAIYNKPAVKAETAITAIRF